ncbi:MAG: 3-hydroxyacyl-CoA dehydrogenase family protein [Myxococcales bacterium]|nr:3-hydroxyacyl-CoA dehydrogenase family protein [Myxococcales bacterium]MCB9648875.1 3-hydroxyacyl-CoA dehydrogenase family protein [Deltaproteobacteria bacterium]
MSDGIQNVLVIGAGTMGAGIAEVAAKAGCSVRLFDVSAEVLEAGKARIERSLAKAVEKGKLGADAAEATRARITYAGEYGDVAGLDLVVEAVPEKMELKKQIFSELSAGNPTCILASNTSSLSLTEIAAACQDPSRVLGMHFFNPPPVMPLLEIVEAEQTAPEITARVRAFAARIDKSPIVVRDMPGFATSRLGIILGMEAIRMLEQGVASAADIDSAMELGYRHPMGPLKLTDLVGLDVRLAIAEHLTRELGPQFTPPPLLRMLVRAGKLGAKTGEGFYKWVDGKAVPKK